MEEGVIAGTVLAITIALEVGLSQLKRKNRRQTRRFDGGPPKQPTQSGQTLSLYSELPPGHLLRDCCIQMALMANDSHPVYLAEQALYESG